MYFFGLFFSNATVVTLDNAQRCYTVCMNLTVEITPSGVKIPVSAFAENVQLEVIRQEAYVLVRPIRKLAPDEVQETEQRFSVDSQRAQMEQEVVAFETQHADLVQTHLGQYVAFHKGKLIDADSDPQTLRKRIRTHYGRAVVMIQQVEATLPPLLQLGSMRQDRS